jgi:hypothetical protein
MVLAHARPPITAPVSLTDQKVEWKHHERWMLLKIAVTPVVPIMRLAEHCSLDGQCFVFRLPLVICIDFSKSASYVRVRHVSALAPAITAPLYCSLCFTLGCGFLVPVPQLMRAQSVNQQGIPSAARALLKTCLKTSPGVIVTKGFPLNGGRGNL